MTTYVTHDKISKSYAAIFKSKHVGVWKDDDKFLDSVEKHRFLCKLHGIVTSEYVSPLLVQKNGAFASLEWAINNKASWKGTAVLRKEEKIVKIQILNAQSSLYLCILTEENNVYSFVIVSLKKENLQDASDVKRIKLENNTEKLVGYVIVQNSVLLTLCEFSTILKAKKNLLNK